MNYYYFFIFLREEVLVNIQLYVFDRFDYIYVFVLVEVRFIIVYVLFVFCVGKFLLNNNYVNERYIG